jgi:nucleoside-diphosphate-sugar epimerase
MKILVTGAAGAAGFIGMHVRCACWRAATRSSASTT